VRGSGGPLPASVGADLFVGTAGTVARFLLAVAAGSPVEATMRGSPRMHERPMDALVAALREQGAPIECLAREGALPVRLRPARLHGGEVRLLRPASSQFVSGLVFAALVAERPTRIVLEQGTPARPYVDMTLAMVREFGGDARWHDESTIVVAPATLAARAYAIEPDASAASYFLALAAIHGGRVGLRDLGDGSLQGDARFAAVLRRLGAEVEQDANRTAARGIGVLEGGDFDLSDMPDMTLTLAVVALFCREPTRITGVGILRHHESDRLAAAATELRNLGAEVTELDDGLRIVPPRGGPARGVAIDTYGDHRMAMAFSLVGEVAIVDPACVGKTYPGYFNELADLGMVVGVVP
jgi:3-phosphoshikimate 1-carboxyvinyltransferase